MKIPLDANVEVKPQPKRTDTVLIGHSMEEGIVEAQEREGKGERAAQRMNENVRQAADWGGNAER